MFLFFAFIYIGYDLLSQLNDSVGNHPERQLLVLFILIALVVIGTWIFLREINTEKDFFYHAKIFMLTNKRFVSICKDGHILEEVEIDKIDRIRRSRLFWRRDHIDRRLGLSLYEEFESHTPLAHIWGIKNYRKARKDILGALEKIYRAAEQ